MGVLSDNKSFQIVQVIAGNPLYHPIKTTLRKDVIREGVNNAKTRREVSSTVYIRVFNTIFG